MSCHLLWEILWLATILLMCSSFQLPSLPVNGPRLARTNQINSYTSTHLCTKLNANILSRFVGVLTSNINHWIRLWEDPEKMIAQAVTDMESDLIRVRQSYAEVLAAQRRMEQQRISVNAAAIEWYNRAQALMKMDKVELAREALARRQVQLDLDDALGKQVQIQSSTVGKLSCSISELGIKIAEARQQKDTYIARAKTAKTSLKINTMLSEVFSSSSVGTFNRMKEKVEALEIEADIAREMSVLDSSSTGTLHTLHSGEQSRLSTSTVLDNKVDVELQRLYEEIESKSPRRNVIDVEYRDSPGRRR